MNKSIKRIEQAAFDQMKRTNSSSFALKIDPNYVPPAATIPQNLGVNLNKEPQLPSTLKKHSSSDSQPVDYRRVKLLQESAENSLQEADERESMISKDSNPEEDYYEEEADGDH